MFAIMKQLFNKLSPRKRRVYEMLPLVSLITVLMMGLAGCSKEEVVPVLDDQGYTKSAHTSAQLFADVEAKAAGSTIGPDGNLYVAVGGAGNISRVDVNTGDVSVFADNLPTMSPFLDFGGPVDVCFRNGTAYALVTLVGPIVGGSDVVGIYRIDGPSSNSVLVDLGAFNQANPPTTNYFVPNGVPYSIESYRDGFLVTDGHFNRVLYVKPNGEISIVRSFGNIVPTGMDLSGNRVYMAEAGPVPHEAANGKIMSFVPASPGTKFVASGARLLVDVEFGFSQRLFGLSQGEWNGVMEGSPAIEDDGSLVQANPDGTFTTIVDELDRPTSLEFIRNTAYIVTLPGEIVIVENVKAEVPF